MRDAPTWDDKADAGRSDLSSDGEPDEVPVFESRKRPRTAGSESDIESVDPYESSSGSSDSEEDALANKVADIPLGRRTELAASGSQGRAALLAKARAARAAEAKRAKRASKHAPAEQSSKKPVPVLRDTMQTTKFKGKDPRFESLSGSFKEDRFRSFYSFLYDEQLPQERRELKAAIKKTKSATKKAQLQADLTRAEQALRTEESRRWKKQFYGDLKSKEKEAVKGGKAPYYLKKSEQKRLELVAKYEELKANGRLEKYMDKRRQKNAKKEHKQLVAPRRQPAAA